LKEYYTVQREGKEMIDLHSQTDHKNTTKLAVFKEFSFDYQGERASTEKKELC
jgi:hypothetical protein